MSESSFEITPDNVRSVMKHLGITEDLLMANPTANLCKITARKGTCKGECSKYNLSDIRSYVGTGDRNGACVLFRLGNIYHNLPRASVLYAPISMLCMEVEDL